MRVDEVIKRWIGNKHGKTAISLKASVRRLQTDGSDLFSYELKIGYTKPDGTKVLLDKANSSKTTNAHIARTCSLLMASSFDGEIKFELEECVHSPIREKFKQDIFSHVITSEDEKQEVENYKIRMNIMRLSNTKEAKKKRRDRKRQRKFRTAQHAVRPVSVLVKRQLERCHKLYYDMMDDTQEIIRICRNAIRDFENGAILYDDMVKKANYLSLPYLFRKKSHYMYFSSPYDIMEYAEDKLNMAERLCLNCAYLHNVDFIKCNQETCEIEYIIMGE